MPYKTSYTYANTFKLLHSPSKISPSSSWALAEPYPSAAITFRTRKWNEVSPPIKAVQQQNLTFETPISQNESVHSSNTQTVKQILLLVTATYTITHRLAISTYACYQRENFTNYRFSLLNIHPNTKYSFNNPFQWQDLILLITSKFSRLLFGGKCHLLSEISLCIYWV